MVCVTIGPSWNSPHVPQFTQSLWAGVALPCSCRVGGGQVHITESQNHGTMESWNALGWKEH